MAGEPHLSPSDETVWAPGTITLEDLQNRSGDRVVLQPVPSSDPNDPLNWSKGRKAFNFTLACLYVLWSYVMADIAFTSWGPMMEDLGFSINILNDGFALCYTGAVLGCVIFIPFVHKYGRRPTYIASVVIMLIACVWQARLQNTGDLFTSNLLSGAGSAISETIVQITIADIFFVHQHGRMNMIYLMFASTGAYLGPVASGYVVSSQGWRWIWWWCVIFLGLNLALVIFAFEETKYVPTIQGQPHYDGSPSQGELSHELPPQVAQRDLDGAVLKSQGEGTTLERTGTRTDIDNTIRLKSYRERLAPITKSEGAFAHHFYQWVEILFTFPAVAYGAMVFGSTNAWFAVLVSIQATYLIEPPYNFSSIGVGLMNISIFVGALLGFVVGELLTDRSVLWLAKRNRGIYEPEMRLWLALPSAIFVPAGILIFGICLAHGIHWIILAIGCAIFGCGLVLCSGVALAYVTDSYQDIVGDALIGITVTRNALCLMILFALSPWVSGMGIQNLHILSAALGFALLCLTIPLLLWGKKARIATTSRYRRMARRQPVRRMM